jgi:acyl carrier protein
MVSDARSDNDAKLRSLLLDVFLMDEALYRDEHGPEQIASWDSLATVSMAVGVNETFGHHMTPQDVAKVKTIGDIKAYLRSKGVAI